MTSVPMGGNDAPSNSDPPTSGVTAKRCRVTLLFADLCDYTALGEAADPEEVADLRQRLMSLAADVIAKHRGTVNQFVGDGIQAIFGFPEADEDEVRHAVSAALELQERARGLESSVTLPEGFHLNMHSGIHSGLVFASRGDRRHGEYELAGDAVNTAARLCGVAGRGEVVVSASTLQGVEGFFELEPVEPLSLKGKKQPVAALRVLAESVASSRFEARSKAGLSPYVGRSRELNQLEEALIGALDGKGSAACVVGEAGLGKTRLMSELRARAGRLGLKVLRGSCENYGGVTPLRPFLYALRELLPLSEGASAEERAAAIEAYVRQLDESLLDQLPALLQLLSVRAPLATEGPQAAAIPAIAALLLAVCQREPTLLLIDDWHWSDDASVQVLGRLLRAVADRSCALVIASRSIDADDAVLASVPRLLLAPFTEAESIRAARNLLESDIGDAALQRVHSRSGGNPLFLEELCGALRRAGDTQVEDSVPNTVHALIRARVDALPSELGKLLGVASVIGNEFPAWLLERVADVHDIDAAFAAPQLAGLVQQTSNSAIFRFKHGLARDTVYETVRVGDRRLLHRRVAEALEEQYGGASIGDHYEALALHYAGARDPVPAARYAELAGDKAAASSALDGARTQYAAALSQLDNLIVNEALQRQWLAIVVKWSAASVYYPAREQLAILARAVEYAKQLNDDSLLAWVEQWTGWIYYGLGGADAAIDRHNRALALAQKVKDERLTAQALVSIGQCHQACGRYDLALDFLGRGLELKRVRPPIGVGGAYALGCRALLLADRGEFARAHEQFHEALELVTDSGNALEGSLLGLLGLVQIWQGNWQAALDTAARGKAAGERVNGPYVLAMCQVVTGYARFQLERAPDALESMRRAVEWLERRDIQLFLSFCYGQLADAALQMGWHDTARDHAGRAIERASKGDPLGEGMAYRVLARLALIDGDVALAREREGLARASGERRGSPRELAHADCCLGELELQVGNAESARAHLSRARAAFLALAMSPDAAHAGKLLERLPTA